MLYQQYAKNVFLLNCLCCRCYHELGTPYYSSRSRVYIYICIYICKYINNRDFIAAVCLRSNFVFACGSIFAELPMSMSCCDCGHLLRPYLESIRASWRRSLRLVFSGYPQGAIPADTSMSLHTQIREMEI